MKTSCDSSSLLEAAVGEIRRCWPVEPRAALVLGTGLASLADRFCVEATISFEDLPGFSPTTALGHRGQVVCGSMRGVPMITLNGRCHIYEGYGAAEITWPIRVVHGCGAGVLVVSNASGGLNPCYATGDVMVVADHINLLGRRAVGSIAAEHGPAMRPGTSPYDCELIEQAMSVARRENITAHCGVYVAVPGPNYETRAEYRFLRQIGGDVVGMSTVPEVILARQLGMRVLGLSFVANVACPDDPEKVDPEHVVEAVASAEPHLRKIVAGVLLRQ